MFIRATRQTFTWLCTASLLALGAASCGDNLPSKTDALSGSGGAGMAGSGGNAGGAGGGTGVAGMGGGVDAGQGGATGGSDGGAGTGGIGGNGTGGNGTGGNGTGGQPDAGMGGQAGSGTGGMAGGQGGQPDAGMGGAGGCQSASDCTNGQICDGSTHTCVPCPSDSACRSGYGPHHVCVSGACISGDCQTFADCSNGQLCVANQCTNCVTDLSCMAAYGADHLCVSGGCVAGECRTAADCPTGQGQICDVNFTCTTCSTDNDCVSGYGANHLCVGGACVAGNCRQTSDCGVPGGGGRICDTTTLTCVSCPDDATCAAAYGGQELCLNGSCVPGNCRTATDCTTPPGQVCDVSTHLCGVCSNDGACVSAYGAGHLCVGGACIAGQCRTSPDCQNGQVCNAATFTCGACAVDVDCTSGYGANHLCIGGQCVSGTCHSTTECGGGEICDATSHTCTTCASDGACVTAYGAQHVCIGSICVAGNCHNSSQCGGGQLCDTPTHFCQACASDTACQSDDAYGVTTVCVAGACTSGDCHGPSSDCPSGQLCGIAQADTCGPCSSDGQCIADPAYGPGNICFQGICQIGDCHGTSSDCTGAKAGLICGALAANDCGACSSDAQCQSDPVYGSAKICDTTTGQALTGKCVDASCSTSGACAANGADFCCSDICTPGNCCSDSDCAGNPSFGSTFRCVNNSCTGCAAATGNTYFVDPVNGDDATATGSGIAGGVATPSCSFKTMTHALSVVSGIGAAGTKIVIVGQSGSTVSLDPGETLPIVVPANVAISTKTGPILLTMGAGTDTSFGGFRLVGDKAVIAPDASAPITIDGASNTSGIGIGVSPGNGKSAAISYVTVQNTGGNGIAVTNGTLTVGQGVTVSNAGSTIRHHDGLNIAGGTVNVVVPAGQATTSFNGNSEHGIYVTGAAVVNINGVPVTPANGQGTVVAANNAFDGLEIFETAGAAGMSTVRGLVAWGNAKQGVQIFGGEKVKIRSSVLLNNKLNGLLVTSSDPSAASNDLSGIDLGVAGDPGQNQIQASAGSNPDLAGLCISMSANQGTLKLSAEGNVFSGPTDCSSATTAIVRSTSCTGGVDLGILPATGTTVAVDLSTCQ